MNFQDWQNQSGAYWSSLDRMALAHHFQHSDYYNSVRSFVEDLEHALYIDRATSLARCNPEGYERLMAPLRKKKQDIYGRFTCD